MVNTGFRSITPWHLLGFVLASAVLVGIIAAAWKFGFEEWIDPFLPGVHGVDSEGEQWEFVLLSSFFSGLALVFPAFQFHRMLHRAAAASRLTETVFEFAPQPMMVVSSAFDILAVNMAWEMLAGVSGNAVLGRKITAIEGGVRLPGLQQKMLQGLDESGFWAGELECVRPTGDQYVVWLSISAIAEACSSKGDHICVFSDITWRKRREDAMLHESLHDALTGLPNRRMFRDRLSGIMADSRIFTDPVAVLFMDLDGFKRVNDLHGHAIGDEVLKVISERLHQCARRGDTVSRFGGDEFVMLTLGVTSLEDPKRIARRCLESLGAVIEVGGLQLQVGVSIGIAISSIACRSPDVILEAADQAMYQAKRLGRGTFVVYEAGVGKG